MKQTQHTFTVRKAQIEPGLLSLFRLTYGIWLLASGSNLLGAIVGWNPFTPNLILNTLYAVMMLLYLFPGWLLHRLGRWYLPIALFITSLVPIMIQWGDVAWRLEHDTLTELLADEDAGLFVPLFIPMVIVTVQYGFRTMIGYSVGTAALQMLIMLTLLPIDEPNMDILWGNILARTIFYPIVAFFVVRLVSGQKKERVILAEKNIELTRYATTVERLAISHERNRLARELHDTLAHTLSAVAVQVEALNKQLEHDPDSAKHTVQQLRDLTRSGLQESRRALQALRASPLEDLGFILALRQLVNSTAERSGIAITLEMPDELDEFTPEIEQGVYRITEEALNNIVRHANAKNATVTLRHDHATLHLTIIDDGYGFNPDEVTTDGHYGLMGMRERAMLCNGQLEIVSSPATGTMIRLTVEE